MHGYYSFLLALSVSEPSLCRKPMPCPEDGWAAQWRDLPGEELKLPAVVWGSHHRGRPSSLSQAFRWLQMTSWPKPQDRFWARTTQLSHSHIPDCQKLSDIMTLVLGCYIWEQFVQQEWHLPEVLIVVESHLSHPFTWWHCCATANSCGDNLSYCTPAM